MKREINSGKQKELCVFRCENGSCGRVWESDEYQVQPVYSKHPDGDNDPIFYKGVEDCENCGILATKYL